MFLRNKQLGKLNTICRTGLRSADVPPLSFLLFSQYTFLFDGFPIILRYHRLSFFDLKYCASYSESTSIQLFPIIPL